MYAHKRTFTLIFLLWLCVCHRFGGVESDSFPALGTYGACFITHPWVNKNLHNHSSAGPRAGLTQLTLPQVQPIIYWTPDSNERRRRERGFVFPFEEVPLCSPKDDFRLWGPNLPQTLLFAGVCLHGQCIYEWVKGCVCVCGGRGSCVRTYKGQSLFMAHLTWWNLIQHTKSMMRWGTSNCV